MCVVLLKMVSLALTGPFQKYGDTSANEDNSLAEIFVNRTVISCRFL